MNKAKRIQRILQRIFLLLLVLPLAFTACMPECHPPKNPYMEDRTNGWVESFRNEIIVSFKAEKNLDSIVWNYVDCDTLDGFRYPIQTEEDVASAAAEVLWKLYHVKAKRQKIYVEFITKKDESWWFAQWRKKYYIVFNKEGEILRSIDLSKNKENTRSGGGFETIIHVQIDLAKLTCDELIQLDNDTGIAKMLKDEIQSYEKKGITAKDAYRYAVEIAQTFYIRGDYDDEFRVYRNEADDVWFVVSCGWIAAFRQSDGELIFGNNFSFKQDKSKPMC